MIDSGNLNPMDAPLVTVILLCYNQELTVGRAIESVLRQRCDFGFEVLVADDASTDNTRSIAEEYVRKFPDRVRLMPRHANKGIVDNYFDAVMAARGKYIGDCAGDDEWLGESRLSMQAATLKEHPDVAAVCTEVECVNADRGRCSIMRGSLFASAPEGEMIKVAGREVTKEVLNHTDALPYVLSGALYRRDPVMKLLEEDPEILRCHDGGVEDVPLIAALGEAGDLMYLPIRGYRYYIDGESASNNLSFRKEYLFTARVASMVRRLGKHYRLEVEDQLRYFNTKFPYMAAQVRHAGDRELLKDIEKRLKEWGLKMPLRGRIHLIAARIGGRYLKSL